MKRELYPIGNGKFLEVKQNKIDTALPYITKRLAYFMPIYTVDVDDMMKLLQYVNVKVNRDCTAEEVGAIVQQIRAFLYESLAAMPKHERFACERGKHDDTKGERFSDISAVRRYDGDFMRDMLSNRKGGKMKNGENSDL